ncbi:MAG: T9SS type A sorting domain-containing protein [Salinivirgaceae bacterium]
MKKLVLILGTLFLSLMAFPKNWIITNDGFSFSPTALTIQLGDTVTFQLASIHNALEVDKTAWDANANDPVTGFTTPNGGGMVLPAQLSVGTHYYVCEFHASSGMKGTITVEQTTGIQGKQTPSAVKVYPNPSDGLFYFSFASDASRGLPIQLEVFDILGQKVLQINEVNQESNRQFDLSAFPEGVYFARFSSVNFNFDQKIVRQ